jgi:hypothetical protein
MPKPADLSVAHLVASAPCDELRDELVKRQLRGDRPDRAPNPAEVVEQPRALGGELRKKRREPKDVGHERESNPGVS